MKGFSRAKYHRTVLLASSAAAFSLASKPAADEDGSKSADNFGYQPHVEAKLPFTAPAGNVLPEVTVLRKVPHLLGDGDKLQLRLYQFQACPFCCKVRAFLDYYGFGYEVVEVDSLSRRQIRFSEYKKVPIVVARAWDNRQLNDSSFIVSLLKSHFVDPDRPLDEIKAAYPIFVVQGDAAAPKFENDNKYFVMYNEQLKTQRDIGDRREEREWRKWVDAKLVHVISPNVYRSLAESVETFRWFSESADWASVFPAYKRVAMIYIGAAVMHIVGKRLRKKHGLKANVRESLYDLCREWTAAVGATRKFMGGERPNLSDLAVYGVLSSFEGCRAFSDMLTNTAIGPWYENTRQAVKDRQGALEFRRS